MLPQNIDLTEHRDFNEPSRLTHIDFSRMIEFSREVDNATIMTGDEFEALMRVESIFGRHPHENGRWYIFGDHRLEKDLEEHCDRCGREIKSPWKRLGLCKECDYIMRRELTSDCFPWYPSKKASDNRNTKEIFQLK